MIDAVALLENLTRRGVRLTPNPPKLIAEPASLLTNEDRTAIRTNKPELLALLVSHYERAKTVASEAEAAGADLSDYIRQRNPELLNGAVPEPGTSPGKSIIESCRRYGVALRIDEAGDLVVGRADAKAEEPTQPWPSLLTALQAHLEAVARLVEAGWTLRADFVSEGAA